MLALCLLAATAAPPQCAPTGGDCTNGQACCATLDHCEAVDQYYSKCVTQPKCAAKEAQCFGTGQSVMAMTPCCDAGYNCTAVNKYYSKCSNGPIPPPPPPPPPAKCAAEGGQCAGGTVSLPCCGNNATHAVECEAVNAYFSKCVYQPTCAADNALCEGTGDHIFKKTGCCDATGHSCVPWGDDWSVCRKKGEETCSAHGEQCAGSGGSSMKPKACCDPKDSCVVVNPYYSKCDSNATVTEELAPDSCPGLEKCPF